MAEKILNTRIQLKYDLYENWMTNNPTLKSGEAAIVVVPAETGAVVQEPAVLIKIGDGTSDFKTLPFTSAVAADVYGWAKAENKPTYEAKEITGIDAYIADYVEEQMGISVDTDTQYQLVKVDDYNFKLQSKGKTDAAWSDVAGSTIAIPNDTAAIEALQELVGSTSVAAQIAAAITALDLANTYEAKGEAAKVQTALDTYKTANDAAVQKLTTDVGANASAITAIKDGTTIDSFADVESALAGKEAAGAAAQALTDAKAYADGKDTAIAEAKKAGTDAAAAAATAQGEIDALEEKVGVVPEGQTVMGIITNIQENAYDDTAVKADIKTNADAIDALEELVGEKAVATQISEAIAAEKLADTYAAKVHKHVKADITDFDHTHEMSEVNGLEAALEGKQAAGDYATKTEAQGYADAKDEAIAEAKKAGTDAQAYAEGVAADLADEVERATGVEAGFETRIAANAGAITKLNANAETEGSVDYKIAQAVAAIMENPDDTMNSINELVTWINGHAEDALELSNKVTANEEAIGDLEGLVGTASVESQINAAIEALKIGDYAKAADLTAAVARIGQNETDIAALKGRMDTAEGDIDNLETEVAKKANDADMAAIAKTGNVNDLVQTAGDVVVFYCGTSDELV